ncbi:MAG TPA: hypothetical protein VGJ77_07620 [Gaiellaceae bacterium]
MSSMLGWITIAALVVFANVLLALAMNGASRALRDWGAAYSRRRIVRRSSPSSA